MNITLFSGGTGSVALTEGLKKIHPNCDITTIINCFDNGKSTGFVRKVLNVLGPSDLRKRQYQLYEIIHKDNIDNRIRDFFSLREDLSIYDNPRKYVLDLICKDLGFDLFDKYINCFFDSLLLISKDDLKDFNLSNIVYGAMFALDGYEKTIEFFKNFLNIEDNVLLNTYDNAYLIADLKSGCTLAEEEIVEYNNFLVPITGVHFIVTNPASNEEYDKVNKNLKDTLDNSDLIIFSAGTQWSSLIPTYAYSDSFKEMFNDINCKKIFIMNTEEDADMTGVTSSDMIDIILRYLPALKDNPPTYLLNTDGADSLNIINPKYSKYTKLESLGNINGKHDPQLLSEEIFNIYFEHLQNFDSIVTDFDDTIFTRELHDEDKIKASYENLKLLDELSSYKQVSIVTGNSYNRIKEKIYQVFGSHYNPLYRIWADGGVVEYSNHTIKESLETAKYYIPGCPRILERISKFNFNYELRGPKGNPTCISIKPIKDYHIRLLLKEFLQIKFPFVKIALAGKTSVDIFNKNTDKEKIFEIDPSYKDKSIVYLGDEIDDGNDKNISKKCSYKYQVKNIYDTNVLLKHWLRNLKK